MRKKALQSKTGTKFIYIMNGVVHSSRATTHKDTRLGQYASATKSLHDQFK